MSTTVLVTFHAQVGRGPQLVAWLKAFHPRLRSFAGFERIVIYDEGDVVVELEQWRAGEDHRAMVAAVDAEAGWDAMGALLTRAPETRYLHAAGGLTASPGVASIEPPLHGGCACGAVRYTCNARPLIAVECFCRDCQRASGGASTTGLAVPAEALAVKGEPRRHVTRADSGNDAWREFCGECGSPLFAGNTGNTAFIAVKVASLDDPGAAAPQVQVWTSSAPAWAHIQAELPSFMKSRPR